MPGAARTAAGPWLVPGLQLAAAVVLAYGSSLLLHLPEGLWAVMSALLVARPHTGAALGAGIERVKGTLLGCAAGLLSIWIGPHGGGMPLAALALVAALAFGSAALPGWRSAPIAALIVMSGGALGAAAPLHVAGLRVLEVGLGVIVGTAVSFMAPGTRSAALFDGAAAALLARFGQQMRGLGRDDTRSADEKDAAAADQRAALRRLGELAIGADRVHGLLRRRRPGRGPHARMAALCGRIAQDVSWFGRTFDSAPATLSAALWAELAATGARALDDAAAALREPTAPPPASLAALAAWRHAGPALALPLAWLADDLRKLLHLRRTP